MDINLVRVMLVNLLAVNLEHLGQMDSMGKESLSLMNITMTIWWIWIVA